MCTHAYTCAPVCDCSTLQDTLRVCAELCGACLCCGRGLEDAACLTGLQRAGDSRIGSEESQTIIPALCAEPSCSSTVISGLSCPALTCGGQRLTHNEVLGVTGRDRGGDAACTSPCTLPGSFSLVPPQPIG